MMVRETSSGKLKLRAFCTSDAGFFERFLASPVLTRYLPLGRSYQAAEIRTHVQERILHWKHGFGTCLIFTTDCPDAPVGYVGAEFVDATPFIDLRYGILETHAGSGIATGAVFLFLREFFTDYPDQTIYGICSADNAPSHRVLQKIGMVPEDAIRPYGPCDMHHLRLGKADFLVAEQAWRNASPTSATLPRTHGQGDTP